MKKTILIIVITACIVCLEGCMTVQLTAEGLDKTAAMTSNVNKKFNIVKHFNRELKGWFTIFNLVTISEPNIKELLSNEILSAQGDAVINVKIQGQTTFIDGAIPVALGIIGAIVAPPYGGNISSLIGARTYTVEGDVIKYSE